MEIAEPQMTLMPDVLIVSYRRADLLERCLRSVDQHLPEARVFVWDNHSDGSDGVRALADDRPDVTWTFYPENVGFAAAVNRLVRESSSPTFFLLNPDAELDSDLARTRAALTVPDVAAAAPWVQDERHQPWDNAHREPSLVRSLVSYAGWDDRVGRHPALAMSYAEQPHEVSGYLTGAGLLISRDAWRAVGEFDERYFLYGEEADWCRRARLRGYRLVSVPETGIIHRAAGTVSDVSAGTSRSQLLLQENRIRYLRSHHGTPAAWAFRAGSAAVEAVQPSKRRARLAAAPSFIVTSPTLKFGGAERQRVALVNGLAAKGERVELRLLQEEGDLRGDVDPRVHVKVAPFHRVVRDAGPETLLVTGTTRIEVAFGAAWRSLNMPHGRWVVANHHYADPEGPTFDSLDAGMMRRADGMIFLSNIHRRDHARHQTLHGARTWVIPNGIDTSRFAGSARTSARDDHPRIVSIGRLADFKEVPVIIEALAPLRDLPWTFDIWGDGPDRPRIEAAIPPELTDRIRLRGWCSDVPATLAEADLFCLSSRFEAQPMVVLEAMAARVAVASSPVASVPEMLQDGAGLLVSPSTADNWSDALQTLLLEPARLDRLAEAGHRRAVADYSEDAMIDRYLNMRKEVFQR